MQHGIAYPRTLLTVLAMLFVIACPLPCLAAEVCALTSLPTLGPDICVQWSEPGGDPVEGFDFVVDFGCSGCIDAPNVELRDGSTTWQVWARGTGNGRDVEPPEIKRNIGALTTTDAESYVAKILRPDGAAGDHYINVLSGSATSQTICQ